MKLRALSFFIRSFLVLNLLASACGRPQVQSPPVKTEEREQQFQPKTDHPKETEQLPQPESNGEKDVLRIQSAEAPLQLDTLFLGTNLPAWLNPGRLADPIFRSRVVASGVKLIRMPGGSWSNSYDWLACERCGDGIDLQAVCYWLWAARPSDFASFLAATGLEGMYTVNQNGTAQEAAALVAYFNGSTDDAREIGVDARGRDWGRVSDWAKLRGANGNPEPVKVRYWEVGNEIYGGKPGSGKDCTEWGWEDVWTCDGAEYVTGIGSGSNHKEGYLEFRQAMRAVDASIQVGAVGVSDLEGWSNWGNEVIASAGQEMDFYVVHEYGFFDPPGSHRAVLARPQQVWRPAVDAIGAAFQKHAGGTRIPVAVTEYNLFAVQERDPNEWMSRALNALFVADSIGQMLRSGVTLTNHWDVAHGEGEDGPGYGLMHADTYFRSPQYYVFPLWARFGNEMLPVESSIPTATMLSVYAGRVDADTYSLMAINKTGSPIAVEIEVEGSAAFFGGLADVLQADSLDAEAVTFNGSSDPSDDLTSALPVVLQGSAGPLAYTFEPYSVTLLRLDTGVTPVEKP